VFKRGGKGRISNELVAASCAAILAVYGAGTWRTRDEARRSGVEGEMRRPARPAQVPASIPAVVAAPPAPQAVTAALTGVIEPKPELEPNPELKKLAKVESAPSPAAVAAQKSSEPVVPVAAATTAEAKPEPAPEPVVAAEEGQPPATVERRWQDGYYTGWGQSRHGDIQAFVRIENGMIIESGVATCETRYPCSVIDNIILQPVDLQGPDVDRVSRATESGDAYYYGLVMALQNAETGTRRSVRP
jgi:uncharacterized protein with FMN-binding domain